MKIQIAITLLLNACIALPAISGTMYEWRDPATGKLKLGDKPPNSGIEYWIEGQKRPEEKAFEEKQKNEQKIEEEKRNAVLQEQQRKQQAEEDAKLEKRRQDMAKFIEKNCASIENDRVRIGMNKETFRLCFGVSPTKINTTATANGTHEQWVYPDGRYYYFTNGILTAIQNH